MGQDALTPAGTLLYGGRYRIGACIGQGGMADVYRAVDDRTGGEVAVKVVRSTDPELARRLTQEARAVAALEHPGLVRVLDTGLHGGQPFLVMELVDGPTLATRLRSGPLPTDRCAALGATLSSALAYVHERGVVHRDVKPGNILLGPGPRARLSDFGVAQLLDASAMTITGTTLGTAAYMAPEQLEHHRVGPAADLWSLGAILLECLTGRRAFAGGTAEVVARRLAGAAPVIEGLPASWRILLGSMLEHDPAKRPAAAEVADMLGSPVYAQPWEPPPATALLGPEATDATAGSATRVQTAPGMAADGRRSPSNEPEPATMTMVGAPAPARSPALARRRTLRRVAAAAAALCALVALLAWAASGSGAPARATHTSGPTTTTPPGSAAAAALVRDVQRGESAGSLQPAVGSEIMAELTQALAAAGRDPQGAANDLGTMEGTIAGAAQSGEATPAEGSALLADIAELVSALRLPPPTTTTTTTTTTAPLRPGPKPPKKH